MLPHNAVVGNPIPFSKVLLREHTLRKLTRHKNHPINGLDTETLNGYARLICDHTGDHILTNDIDDILTYLTQRKFRSHHNFFYNLRYDMNAVIKYLPRENLEELHERGKTNFGDYRIGYIPKKLFNITHSKHVHKFYDIAQFFETTLDKASVKYLGESKYTEDIDRETLGASAQYWSDNLPSIIRYCIHDALLTKRLSELLQNTLIKKVELTPQNYISKASLSKEYLRVNAVIPDTRHIPYRALGFAFNSYHGGRFEILKKGRVGKCSLIDIKSAYPHKIRNLVDVSTGSWRKTLSLHEEAIYGYYLVVVTTDYRNVCPLAFQHKGLVTCFPVIQILTYLTKNELLAYEGYIDYEIRRGWEYFEDNPTYPFRHVIDDLYERKQSVDKKHYEYDLYKKIMNAMYGSFYEKRKHGETWRAGKLFNPIYATEITADTRIQVYNEGMKYDGKLVGFATDSLLIEGTVGLPHTEVLGEWDVESVGDTIVLRSGMYRIGEKVKERGIPRKKEVRTPTGEYVDVFEYIESVPNHTIYPIYIKRPINFVEALIHHKKRSPSDINLFLDHEYKVDINKDNKRLWDDTFYSGGELFEKKIKSRPLILA